MTSSHKYSLISVTTRPVTWNRHNYELLELKLVLSMAPSQAKARLSTCSISPPHMAVPPQPSPCFASQVFYSSGFGKKRKETWGVLQLFCLVGPAIIQCCFSRGFLGDIGALSREP